MSSSFWDEFKKLFKSKQQLQEDKSTAIKDALVNEAETVQKLQALEDAYNDSLTKHEDANLKELFPDSLGLEKKDYQPKSAEELEKQAKTELASSLEESKQKLISDVAAKHSALEDSAENLKDDKEESVKELQELYSTLKKQASDSALKRGLGRSSIIMGQIENYDDKNLKSAAEVEKGYIESINKINIDINKLDKEREIALGNLDLAHASDVAKRIGLLEKERDNTVLEYEKYNNSVDDKERKYKIQREEDIAKYLKNKEATKRDEQKAQAAYESQYGYSGEKQENYAKRYSVALAYYMTLSPDISADALQSSPNMRYYLGNNYDKLLDTLKTRAVETDRYY